MKYRNPQISTPGMRILMLGNIAPYRIGGAEVQARLLAEVFTRRGHYVTIAGYGIPNGRIAVKRGIRTGFDTIHLPTLQHNRMMRALSYFFSLSRLLITQRKRFDIIFCFMISEAALVTSLLKFFIRLDLPCVARTECAGSMGDAAFLSALPGTRWLVRLLNYSCNAINILTPAIKTEMIDLGLFSRTFTYIPNGIPVIRDPISDLKHFDGHRSFLFAGRLVPQKGLLDLLNALSLVRQKGYDFELNIVGDGVLADTLKKETHRLSLEQFVVFHGMVAPEAMCHHYRSNHILILSSHCEGQSLAVNEAMSHALPVIVTRSGGPEFFVDASMGIVCDPGDVEGLAEAMITMIRMPGKALQAMGLAGQAMAGHCFDIEIVADRFLALFNRLKTGQGKAPAQ